VRIAVCWKWVSLDSDHDADRRWSGVSDADQAALEVALAITDRRTGAADTVTVICVAPSSADDVLRDAVAAGATSVLRIDASTGLDSNIVATALAEHLADVDLVLCGDYSLDRGTGSVPAFIAAELGCAQALGLVQVDTSGTGDAWRVVRRLDGGRREILDVTAPAVLSVEGAAATLRRAPLAASLAARTAEVPVVPGPHGRPSEVEIHPYRPRARVLPAPGGGSLDRVRQILDVGGTDVHAERITLEPAAAAARILDQLRDWGYLDTSPTSVPGAG
jgi:electron transfer flavoprotein beta subunit